MIKKMKKGFTLIELLVVIAIIALLSTLAVVALTNARQKSRDAKRVADIKQVQTALELYFADQNPNGYPVATVTLSGTGAACLGNLAAGFTSTGTACTAPIYMGQVPTNPTPNGANYTYSSAGTTYSMTFVLEGQTGTLGSGTHTADQDGIR